MRRLELNTQAWVGGRSHCTRVPALELEPREQLPDGFMKPKGFWYQVGDSWEEWCSTEMPDWLTPFVAELEVDHHRILCLKTPRDIYDFTEKYAVGVSGVAFQIDWRTVATEYAGIEIAPYQWSCRLDMRCSWYYGWDVASGCVWDVSAVRITKVRKRVRSTPSEMTV